MEIEEKVLNNKTQKKGKTHWLFFTPLSFILLFFNLKNLTVNFHCTFIVVCLVCQNHSHSITPYLMFKIILFNFLPSILYNFFCFHFPTSQGKFIRGLCFWLLWCFMCWLLENCIVVIQIKSLEIPSVSLFLLFFSITLLLLLHC